MAENSFKIKAWAITLVVITLIIRTNTTHVYIALIPLFTFWFLDAYYLQQERIFRNIYKDKVNKRTVENLIDEPFKIDTTYYKCHSTPIIFLMLWNKSITPLYMTILLLLILVGTDKSLFKIIDCIKNCI